MEDNDNNKLDGLKYKRSAFEMALIAENEMAGLQRNYRALDASHQKGLEAIDVTARKYKRTGFMSALLRDEQNLAISLSVAASDNYQRIDDLTIKELKHLLQNHSQYNDNIHLRKEYLQELDDQIKKIELKMIELRVKNKASENKYHERFQIAQNNISKLENRLEMQTTRFACIVQANVKLRQEIQNLMNERKLFSKDWGKFFNILELSKMFMHDLTEQTIMIYSEREEFCQKIDVLSEKTRSELNNQSEEIRGLYRVINYQKCRQELLIVKSQRRVAVEAIKKTLLRRARIKIETKRKHDDYVKMLDDVQEYSGSANVYEIQQQFLEREESFFSLFNILNNLYDDSERIASNIQYLQTRWGEEIFSNESLGNNQRKTLENLKLYLQYACKQVAKGRQEMIKHNTKLSTIFCGIASLFTSLKCDTAAVENLLGHFPRGECDSMRMLNDEDADPLLCVKPVIARIDKTNLVIDIHNINIFLTELETNIHVAMKNALLHQKVSIKPFVSMNVGPIADTLKIDQIRTPCPLCVEDSQSILCPTSAIMAWSRDTIVKKMAEKCSEVQLLDTSLHTVSRCQMPQAGLVLKKRYMDG